METKIKPFKEIPPHFPYGWESDYGEDGNGIWASFIVHEIRHTFRWIGPGEFMMGSPETEPERYEDELQHKVILTKGCWMAETTCTQQLWEAVMGNNPSRFKGEQLPVEMVSWDDCREFIRKINAIVHGLNVRLPTEAEWEYACRAGTAIPFYFGNTITPNQVNYDGERPYNKGEKGEYRKKTVEVYELPCNGWELYQMHGNVWEWCEDWYAEYESGTGIDPRGPKKGGSRVLRGGGWIGSAGDTRSACRGRLGPAPRSDGTGFRLARGH